MKRIREQVHAALKANPGATVDRLAELVGKPRNAVYQHLRRLRAAGRACNKGSTTGGSLCGPGTQFVGEWHPVETESSEPIRRVASVWDFAAQL